MPLIDDIKENTAKLKGKSLKYKLQYFFQYYGIATLVILAVCFFLFSLIKTMVTAKDTAFQAIMVNAFEVPDEEAFADYLGIDKEEYEVIFDNSYQMSLNTDTYNETSYTTAQKLMAVVASGTADVMLGDSETISGYMNSGFFGDLRDFYNADTLDGLGDKVIWYQPVDEETGEPVGSEVPVAIEVTDAPLFTKNNCFLHEHVYMTVIINSKHHDYCQKFLDYIYNK